MEQKTPVPPPPPPPPQIKDEAARRAEMRHFPIFDLGGGGSRFSIYFVQDCSLRDVEWGGETREGYIPVPRLFSVCYAG